MSARILTAPQLRSLSRIPARGGLFMTQPHTGVRAGANDMDKALDAASLNNWTVVSMKDDWKRIFKFQ
jgi:hypothetical protein